MPAKSVDEINFSNWSWTGSQVQVDQAQFDIQVKWTDMDGVQHEHNSTRLWPNVLADVPVPVLREWATQQVTAAVRVALGIGDWSQYE